ncbi:MAG: hypothetical protein GY765_27000 [bacterium]|nr:hypothetical protein [bacterium]
MNFLTTAKHSVLKLSQLPQGKVKTALLLFFCIFVCIAGYFLVGDSTGSPATGWMKIFHASDFQNAGDVFTYLKNLRVPIPPVLSLMEIIDYQVSGNMNFVLVFLYRFGMVLAYILALILASKTTKNLVFTFSLSIIFLWGTTYIHPPNPQVYDILLPFFLLLFLVFLKYAALEKLGTGKVAILLAVLSGFFLSMAELSRPYIIVIFPFLVAAAYFILAKKKKKMFLYFIIPVVLLSGTWHLKLLVFNGQVVSTNHSGFNLAKCWSQVELPKLKPEPGNAPLAPGRWANLNTAEHGENSKRVRGAILKYMFLEHPLNTAAHVLRRFRLMMGGPTKLYKYVPSQRYGIVHIYKFLVMMASCWLLINVYRLLEICVKDWRNILKILILPENILIILTFFSFGVLSIGEAGEESRFVISLLPLLAVLPAARGLEASGARPRRVG